MPEQNFTPGLYDHPLSAAIDQLLSVQEESLHHLEPLDPAEAPQRLARYLRQLSEIALASLPEPQRQQQQLALVNQIVGLLQQHSSVSSSPPGLRMALRLIPNEQLLLERIPDPEGDLRGWECFAHTINGYEVMGGFESCADLANRGTPTSLTELRCCLFFEARRERHSGGFSSNDQQIRALLRAIRQNVANGEFA